MILLFFSCKKNEELISEPPIESTSNEELLNRVKQVDVIAFGSCSHQDEPQPLWDDIIADDPDLWIWLGDNIYADTEDMSRMASMYTKQKAIAGYKNLTINTPVIGTWDDHDYGINDGDKSYPKRKESRDLLLNFLDVPEDKAVWNREGAYHSFEFGDVGNRLKVILLDTRYFRDKIDRVNRVYIKDDMADMLGEAQWAWLEEELKSDANLFVICSGIQIIPEEHAYEKWANMPTARARFMDMMSTVSSKVLLLSGDRHFGEISAMDLPNGKKIYELTSSGLSHSYDELVDEPNKYRQKNFTNQLNYGVVEIDWTTDEPLLKLHLKGDKGTTATTVEF